MSLILRMSRLFVAMTLLTGPSGPVFASAPSSPNKEGVRVQLGGSKKADSAAKAKVVAGYGKLPVAFEANRGQSDASVKFLARVNAYRLFLTANEAVWILPLPKRAKGQSSDILRMSLKGSNSKPVISGRDVLPGHTSYFIGNDPKKWQVGVEQYAKVEYRQVYPGIDLVYYGNQRTLEHDFIVAPGANPGRILLHFEGARGMTLNAKGDVILSLKGQGKMTLHAPVIYQTAGTVRQSVKGRFVLAGKNNLRFEVGAYDRSRELVIDPQIVYGTYLGGSFDDAITGVAVDQTGQAYVTGWARSDTTGSAGFPTPTITPTPFAPNGNRGSAIVTSPKNVFVAKISADGTALMWLAWLGGTAGGLDDEAKGIALDNSSVSTPKVYITGQTQSPTFPVVGNPTVLKQCNTIDGSGSSSSAFVAELSQTSNSPALVYSTCWGSASASVATNTSGNAIAVDSLGAAYVTGTTFASDFLIRGGPAAPYNTFGGSQEAFAFKVAPAGLSMAYSMLMGQTSGTSDGNAIAVDATGQAWVAGATASDTFPGTQVANLHSFSTSRTGGSSQNAFVAQVNASGTGLLYATYINGNLYTVANAIALNNGGATPYHVFVAGTTNSPTDFPSTAYYLFYAAGTRTPVYQKDIPGGSGYHPFIVRLNPFLTDNIVGDTPEEMVYGTYLGNPTASFDSGVALALDSRDDAYVAGWTQGSAWGASVANLDPVTDCSSPCVSNNVAGNTTALNATQDAIVAAIGPAGLFMPFWTYLGGVGGQASPTPLNTPVILPTTQGASGIAIDALHNIYVVGYTPSTSMETVTGSIEDGTSGLVINRNAGAGALDGFIVKLAPVTSFGGPLPGPAPAVSTCTITSISVPSGAIPPGGFTIGGDTVTIVGTDFNSLVPGLGSVTFDAINASSITRISSTEIRAVTPRHLALPGALQIGDVPLTVTTSTNSFCTYNSYRYTLAPVVPSVPGACGDDYFFPSPATGVRGTFAYCMALPGTARIQIYNVVGDLVAKIEESKAAGAQLSTVSTAKLAPGVYLYRLTKDYGGGNSTHSGVKKFVVRH